MNVSVKVKYAIDSDSYTCTPTYFMAYIKYKVEGDWRSRTIRSYILTRGGNVSMSDFESAICKYLSSDKDKRIEDTKDSVLRHMKDNYTSKKIKKMMDEGLSFTFKAE